MNVEQAFNIIASMARRAPASWEDHRACDEALQTLAKALQPAPPAEAPKEK